MRPLRLPRLKAWQWLLLALGALAATAAGGWALLNLPLREWIAELMKTVEAMGPGWFFLVMSVLPAIGAPMAPFYLAAGAAFPLPVAIVGSVLALSANVALSYALARWLLHPVAERLVVRFGYSIPKVRREDSAAVTLLLRITPGPPFFIQSYLLGLAGVPFWTYMGVSAPVCAVMATALIVFGDSLTKGSVGQLVIGLTMIIAALVAVRLVRRMMQRRAAAAAAIVDEAEARTPNLGAES